MKTINTSGGKEKRASQLLAGRLRSFLEAVGSNHGSETKHTGEMDNCEKPAQQSVDSVDNLLANEVDVLRHDDVCTVDDSTLAESNCVPADTDCDNSADRSVMVKKTENDDLGDVQNDPVLSKYWWQRYRLFSRFDQGIRIDRGCLSCCFIVVYCTVLFEI